MGVPPDRQDGDAIDEEAVLAENALVARPDIGMGEKVEHLVGAGAADDAAGIEAVFRRDGRP